jgi:hypothetical protein
MRTNFTIILLISFTGLAQKMKLSRLKPNLKTVTLMELYLH